MKALESEFQYVMSELRRWGALLESAPRLPSVAGSVIREPVQGSWRSHPRAAAIAAILDRVHAHPDVLTVQLISARTTLLDRDLWPPLLAAAGERAKWQLDGLPPGPKRLLKIVEARGECRTDRLSWTFPRTPAESARELERRLLVWGDVAHTDSGAHARQLETWEHWKERVGFTEPLPIPEEGRKKLEEVLAALNARFKTHARLPWM